jgi:hypothetical protein
MHRRAVAAAVPWIGTVSASVMAIRTRVSLDGIGGILTRRRDEVTQRAVDLGLFGTAGGNSVI